MSSPSTFHLAAPQKIILASHNPGKLREFAALLAALDIELVSQRDLGVPPAGEPHATFLENALAKARHASRATGLPALADDSGLCVTALGDAPGVHSARYAQMAGGDAINATDATNATNATNATDAANNARLLAELAHVPPPKRQARYVAVLVLVRHADDPQPLIGEGVWHGQILTAARGAGGFGYDPLFWLPELGKSAAELTSEEKNRASHRAQALQALLARLRASRNESSSELT